MADSGEYDEDARRIERDYVPPSARTREQVRQALRDVGFPESSIDHIAGTETSEGWLQTESEAWDAVDPTDPDVDAIASGMDRQSGAISQERARSIGDHVSEQAEDAQADAWGAVSSGASSAGEVDSAIRRRGSMPDSAAREIADDVATTASRARTQAVAQSGQISPQEAGVSDRSTPVSTIRNESGDVVGVAGGYEDDRQAIAEQEGARAFDSLEEVQESMTVVSDGETVAVNVEGQTVRRFST